MLCTSSLRVDIWELIHCSTSRILGSWLGDTGTRLAKGRSGASWKLDGVGAHGSCSSATPITSVDVPTTAPLTVDDVVPVA